MKYIKLYEDLEFDPNNFRKLRKDIKTITIELKDNGFKIVGTDDLKEARILELINHPFFIATLFVPQDNSFLGNPHKLINAFLTTVCKQKGGS